MDKVMKPSRLDIDSNSPRAEKDFNHWLKTFNNFLKILEKNLNDGDTLDKLAILENYISSEVYDDICDSGTFSEAISVLTNIYSKPKSEIYTRHLLATRKQEISENLEQYFKALNVLSRDCNFSAVTAVTYKEESIRDSFISGIKSNMIRQRLLENKTLTMQEAYNQARSLELAQVRADNYQNGSTMVTASAKNTENHNIDESDKSKKNEEENMSVNAIRNFKGQKCYFCLGPRHPTRDLCPAKDADCKICKKIGHFARACKSGAPGNPLNTHKPVSAATLASVGGIHSTLRKTSIPVK